MVAVHVFDQDGSRIEERIPIARWLLQRPKKKNKNAFCRMNDVLMLAKLSLREKTRQDTLRGGERN